MPGTSADNLGMMCGILPPGPVIAAVAAAWCVIGFMHVTHVVETVAGDAVGAGEDWALAASCQGAACHAEWRENMASCRGNYEVTFRLRYLSVGILGLVGGYLGFQGALTRNVQMMRMFFWFFLLMFFIHLFCLISDQTYVLLCSVFPKNMQRDVEWMVPKEQWQILRAQGYKDLTGIKAEKVRRLIGFDYNTPYILNYILMLLGFLFFIRETWKLMQKLDEGPVGLGPLFTISVDSNREVQLMADRIADVVSDTVGGEATSWHPSFANLEAGNSFPYIGKSGSKTSITYGTLGASKPATEK